MAALAMVRYEQLVGATGDGDDDEDGPASSSITTITTRQSVPPPPAGRKAQLRFITPADDAAARGLVRDPATQSYVDPAELQRARQARKPDPSVLLANYTSTYGVPPEVRMYSMPFCDLGFQWSDWSWLCCQGVTMQELFVRNWTPRPMSEAELVSWPSAGITSPVYVRTPFGSNYPAMGCSVWERYRYHQVLGKPIMMVACMKVAPFGSLVGEQRYYHQHFEVPFGYHLLDGWHSGHALPVGAIIMKIDTSNGVCDILFDDGFREQWQLPAVLASQSSAVQQAISLLKVDFPVPAGQVFSAPYSPAGVIQREPTQALLTTSAPPASS